MFLKASLEKNWTEKFNSVVCKSIKRVILGCFYSKSDPEGRRGFEWRLSIVHYSTFCFLDSITTRSWWKTMENLFKIDIFPILLEHLVKLMLIIVSHLLFINNPWKDNLIQTTTTAWGRRGMDRLHLPPLPCLWVVVFVKNTLKRLSILPSTRYI